MFTTITIILTILSFIGVYLNVKQKTSCFYFWIIANSGWIVVNFHKDIPAQAIMFIAYTGTSIWGLVEWRKRDKKNAQA